MDKINLYFDSNVWINYLWIEKVSFSKVFDTKNLVRKSCHKIVTNLDNDKYKVTSSLFNDTEISNYFSDYLRFLRGLGQGFDYTNSHKYKQQFNLTREEKKQINLYLTHIADLNYVEIIELNLDTKSLEFFRIAILNYQIEYMDAFHLICAMASGCRYIVTADKDFCKKANKLLRDQKLTKDIRVLYFKEAIRVIK